MKLSKAEASLANLVFRSPIAAEMQLGLTESLATQCRLSGKLETAARQANGQPAEVDLEEDELKMLRLAYANFNIASLERSHGLLMTAWSLRMALFPPTQVPAEETPDEDPKE